MAGTVPIRATHNGAFPSHALEKDLIRWFSKSIRSAKIAETMRNSS
jgi:hypothetical protein